MLVQQINDAMKISQIICFACCLLFFSLAHAQQKNHVLPGHENKDSVKKVMALQKKELAKQYAKTTFTYLITNGDNHQFGYYIFCNGQLLIDQKTIPAIPGNNGFVTKDDAKEVAALAIRKIKQGEMPPTISVAEIKKMKIKGVN